MKPKYKMLLKDIFIFALGSMGSKLVLFFLVPLYTNYLTTEEYGTAELVSTFAQLIIPFVSLVINEAVIRFGMMKEEKPENVALAAFIVLGLAAVVTLAIMPLLGLYSAITEWKWYLFPQIILTIFADIERAYLKVKGKNKTYALISILQTIVLATANLILLIHFHSGIRGYLSANIIASGTALIFAFFASDLHKDLKKAKFDIKLLKRMAAFSSPLIFNNVSWWVIHSSDKIMIELMLDASALGIYTAATKIPSLINVLNTVFNQAWGISSIKEIESSNDTEFYSSVFTMFNTIVFAVAMCFTAIMKPFMAIYVGEAFRESWKYVPLLLSAAAFYAISAYFGTLYAALQRTVNSMWTAIVCAVVNVVVNYFLISKIGTWGAVLGTLTAYFIIAHMRMADVRRYIPIKINTSKYIINVILMLAQAILVSIEWHQVYVSIFAIIAFILNNRKEIVQCIELLLKINNKT